MRLPRLRLLLRSLPIHRAFATVSSTATGVPIMSTHPGFVGKCVLAPMVRTGELATRLVSLKYGADAVWGPEIVDRGIIGCTREVNHVFDTIDFVRRKNQPGKSEERVVFRTKPSLERGKLIFQIGSASPELAVEGAKLIVHDVAGIDVNAGCPKHFSIHCGMGAALLKNPDNLAAILTALVEEVGKPNDVPISVKIRILDTKDETLALVRRLCTTGIARLTVHCRTTPMRPRERAVRDQLVDIVKVCHEAGVQCYANGDVETRVHAEKLIEEFGVDGCMIATAAEANPSCFHNEGPFPWREVAEEYLRVAMDCGNQLSNAKFCISHFVPGKDPLYQKVVRSKTMGELCSVFDIPYTPKVGDTTSLGRPLKVPEPSKVVSEAVRKAQKSSETAQAAGGSSRRNRIAGKKLSQRGVSPTAIPALGAGSEQQPTATPMV